jgi:hypothetical protein
MRKIRTIAFLLVLSASPTAQQRGVHAATNAAAEGEIKALEPTLADFIVRGDRNEYAKHPA